MRLRADQCMRIVWAAGVIPLLASSAFAQGAAVPMPAMAPKPAAHPAVAATGKVTPPNAKKLLASAEAKRAAGDYEGALADYQASDAVAPSPVTVEGIAFCHDKLGHFDDALTWYDGFLANPPPALQEQANAATARVAAIKAMPGHLHLETLPANAAVTIDGKDAPTHTPLDVDLPAGKHVLHVTAADHDPVDKDVEVVSRKKQNLALELLLTPPPPPPPVAVVPPAAAPPPAPPHSLLPAIVTGGLAVIAAGVGVGFGVAALNDHSSFNKNPTNATANSGEDAALGADMSFGIALTLGVTSVILFTTRNEQTTATPAAPAGSGDAPAAPVTPKASASIFDSFTATPFVTPHGGGAGAQVRF